MAFLCFYFDIMISEDSIESRKGGGGANPDFFRVKLNEPVITRSRATNVNKMNGEDDRGEGEQYQISSHSHADPDCGLRVITSG